MTASVEVADVFWAAADWRTANDPHLSRDQRRVYGAVRACRTAALGGHSESCGHCGYSRIAYNSFSIAAADVNARKVFSGSAPAGSCFSTSSVQ